MAELPKRLGPEVRIELNCYGCHWLVPPVTGGLAKTEAETAYRCREPSLIAKVVRLNRMENPESDWEGCPQVIGSSHLVTPSYCPYLETGRKRRNPSYDEAWATEEQLLLPNVSTGGDAPGAEKPGGFRAVIGSVTFHSPQPWEKADIGDPKYEVPEVPETGSIREMTITRDAPPEPTAGWPLPKEPK